MQVLKRTVRGKDGPELLNVRVVRIWSDASGIQIGLTPEGDYISLDGKPIEDPKYFSKMPDEEKRMAEKWWRGYQDRKEAEAKGLIVSEEEKAKEPKADGPSQIAMVTAVLDVMRKQQSEFLVSLGAMLQGGTQATEVPMMRPLYSRAKGNAINHTNPKDWPAFGFEEQPDWWGPEAEIELKIDGQQFTFRRYFVPDVRSDEQFELKPDADVSFTDPSESLSGEGA